MRKILSSWRHHYVAKVCIFLIAVAPFIAGMADCIPEYNLTMVANPPVGGTATDSLGLSPYRIGTAVGISAVAAAGYQFVNWTAPAGTFDDANAAAIHFTMPAQNVAVTANFRVKPGPLDHFKCYRTQPRPIGKVVSLQITDQFVTINATVRSTNWFCNPVEKRHDGKVTTISDRDHHLTLYSIKILGSEGEWPQTWQVKVDNQFGDDQELTVSGPVMLAVPTQKEGHERPVGLDHFLLYQVIEGPYVNKGLYLIDQFHHDEMTGDEVTVYKLAYFANPAWKTHEDKETDIVDEDAHLVFYWIKSLDWEDFNKEVQVTNQFISQTVGVAKPLLVALPSVKKSEKKIGAALPEKNAADVVVANTNCEYEMGTYSVTFNVTGDLVEGTTAVTIEFPTGTVVPATFPANSIQLGNAAAGMAFVPAAWITVAGQSVTFYSPIHVVALVDPVVWVFFDVIAPTVTIHGITNPPAGQYTLNVNTSAPVDVTPVASNPYTIVPWYQDHIVVP